MDKKTILTVVIMVAAFSLIFFIVMPLVQGKNPFAPQAAATPLPIEPSPAATLAPATAIVPAGSLQAQADKKASPAAARTTVPAATPEIKETEYSIKTDVLTAVFSNKGGQLVSFKINNDKGPPIEMILKGDQGSYFFGTSFGDYGTPASKELMDAKMIDGRTIEFSYDYAAPDAFGEMVPFTFRKRFSFNPGEYLFDVKISIENSGRAVPNVLNKGFAYTLFLGPQIGPDFKKLSNYDESRTYRSFSNGKPVKQNIKANSVKTVKDRSVWAAVIGKYFTLIAIPDATDYTIVYNTNRVPGVTVTSQMSLSRPALSSSTTVDSFRFYIGPKKASELGRYNDAKKNALGISGLKISTITDTNPLFGWLENALKWMLIQCQKLLLNWGLAIVMVTLIIKVVFFPLSLKGSISMAKMSELQPKIAELQAKFKDKPEKLNQEMMEFYKKEGANPLSGCLPMLIQIPIFFAMYQLFNTHFDLRGAMFIPGWISDLSQPDSILNFTGINILSLEFNAIRILPVVYVVSQLFYGKYTQMSQPTPGQNAMQMKLMMYGMPIFFFFILYNAPAGLLVYWITQNVLTIVQQVITNRIIHQRKLRRS